MDIAIPNLAVVDKLKWHFLVKGLKLLNREY